jgi:hypothetical protein
VDHIVAIFRVDCWVKLIGGVARRAGQTRWPKSRVVERKLPHRYWLASVIRPKPDQIEISEAECMSLGEAVNSLVRCAEAEENFEGLLDGYIEFESFALSEALQSLFWRDRDDVQDQARRTSAGRKLSYFLSSAQFYLDSIQRLARVVLGDETNTVLTRWINREFDGSLSYRIMECLRDHAQHRAFPVHGYILSRHRTEDLEFQDFSFIPTLDLTELIANHRLRQKTIKEIRIMTGPSSIDIKPLARSYLESLLNIHQAFRLATSKTVDRHIQLIQGTKAKMLATFPEVTKLGCAIITVDETGQRIGEPINLTNTLDEYVKFLLGRNRFLSNFSRRRVVY